MRVLFAGTPAVAVPALDALVASSHDVVGVLTRPPAPVGRKRVLTPSPVHERALHHGVPVLTSSKPHERGAVEAIAALAPDVAAVVAYGALLREPVLSMLRHGWLNLHFSLLPAWRGAAPVQHALMAGDDVTGASVFGIEAGLDTGPVHGTVTERVRPDDTAGDLLDRLAHAGTPLLIRSLDAVADGTAQPQPQPDEGVSLAPQLTAVDGELDWKLPASVLHRRLRALSPAPGSWTTNDGQRYKLAPAVVVADAGPGALGPGEVAPHDGSVLVGTATTPLRLTRLAPPGRSWMDAADWARGARLEPGWGFDLTRITDTKDCHV